MHALASSAAITENRHTTPHQSTKSSNNGNIFSLSNNVILDLIIASATTFSSAQAGENLCPFYNQGSRIQYIAIYNGPPEELANLMGPPLRTLRDGSQMAVFDLAYIFKQGRRVYVQCNYLNNAPPIVSMPPITTRKCVFTSYQIPKTGELTRMTITCRDH